MEWDKEVDIDNAVIIPARFGGPIAVIRDRVKAVRMGLNGIGKPVIAIYSSSGRFISSFVVGIINKLFMWFKLFMTPYNIIRV